jgi:hypothetical protein
MNFLLRLSLILAIVIHLREKPMTSREVSTFFHKLAALIFILTVAYACAYETARAETKKIAQASSIFCNTESDVLAFVDQHINKGQKVLDAIAHVNEKIGISSCGGIDTYLVPGKQLNTVEYEAGIVGIFSVYVVSVKMDEKWQNSPMPHKQFSYIVLERNGLLI